MDGSSGSSQADIETGTENRYTPLETSMSGELTNIHALSPDCCIYIVPQKLRCVNAKAYKPQIVSIGPLHHGKKSLKPMEMHKKRYLQDFLDRSRVMELKDYIEKIKEKEEKLRNCYAEPMDHFDSDQFVKIILVDAAFIIELLLKNAGVVELDEGDRIFKKPWMINHIVPDMLLLENQLPFFILEDLFGLHLINTVFKRKSNTAETGTQTETKRLSINDLFGKFKRVVKNFEWIKGYSRRGCNTAEIETKTQTQSLSMINLCYEFFEKTVRDREWTKGNLEKISPSGFKVLHFVDLIRTLHLPLEILQTGGPLKTLITPSITKLHQAGVKFEVRPSKSLLDIQFTGGTLKIPKLKIEDDMELKLRNLIAFEQCHCEEKYICDYASMMDDFVNTPKDVELLAKCGILENFIGDNNKVCTMINDLCNGVIWDVENFYFAAVSEELNDYCKKRRHKWMAILKQNYCNTPWATFSVIAAIVLLILTVTQTVCSIISLTYQH